MIEVRIVDGADSDYPQLRSGSCKTYSVPDPVIESVASRRVARMIT